MSWRVTLARLCAAVMLAAPLAAAAHITDITVDSVKPFADGASFGDAGAYERLTGTARGELDPFDVRNRGIVNLDKAPRNSGGNVEYTVEFDMLRPVRGGNRKMLYDVTNRGRKFVLHWLLEGTGPSANNNPLTAADAGNAMLLRQGWTIVWAGWDPDAPKANNGLSLTVPVARNPEGPIVRVVRDELVSGTRGPVLQEFTLAFEAASQFKDDARLTVRRKEGDPRVPVPAAEWDFKDARTVRILTQGNAGRGPAAGSLYEMHYRAANPKVQGIGFAATRDLVSFFRYERETQLSRKPNPAGTGIKTVLGFGISQSGRYLRDHIAQGFNQDEGKRKVFDGVLTHISGVGRVFLNDEFGQPARTNTQHEDHLYPENAFPFSAAAMADPLTGKSGSLLRGDGYDPLLIEVNTSTEYWQKGASLLHTDPLGTRDVALPAGTRVYLVAGTQHGGRVGQTTARGPCANERNPHNPAPALRALLVALDQWVSAGTPPPASNVPTFSDETLVPPDSADFPKLPGFEAARQGNEIMLFGDWVQPKPDASKRYVPLVSAIDPDGNEVAGIRLPDIAAPLATYTGWNLYKSPFPEGELCDRDGSHSAFAATRAEREQAGDPRLSLQERYAGHADYVQRVKTVVDRLVATRLLLKEDGDAYVVRAGSDVVKKRFAD
jgi:Alpha/beta hydrolase domain